MPNKNENDPKALKAMNNAQKALETFPKNSKAPETSAPQNPKILNPRTLNTKLQTLKP